MRRKLVVVFILVALALLGSCDFFGNTVTMDQCVSNFMSAINTDKASVYKSLDSDSSFYNLALSASYWDSYFPSGYRPFTFSGQSTSGNRVSATLNAGVLYINTPVYFDMVQDLKGNYVISTVTVNGSAIFY